MEIIYEEGEFSLYRYQLNQADKTLDEFMRVRTSIWSKPGWADVPEGQLELDEFDSSATFLVVTYQGQAVGGLRLINADSPNLLPFAQFCEQKAFTEGPATEVSRWCINSNFPMWVRKTAHHIMIKGALKYLKSHQVEITYMDVCSFLYAVMEKLGVTVKSLGVEHSRSDGSTFIPAAIDIFASANRHGI